MPAPNFVRGIGNWAQGHKGQAVGIAAGLLFLVFVLILSGGGPDQGRQVAPVDDMFGAGAMPDDATTASAISEMEGRMETLQLTLNRQQEADAKLAQALEHQKNMFETRLADQERMYTDQLEAALRQAIDLARQTEQRADTQADLAPPAPRLRILRPGGPVSPAEPAAAPPPPPPAGTRPGGPWVRLPIGSTVTGELLTGAFATKARGDALPVLVQLRSAYSGPNDTEIPLEDCLLIGKATADISSVRARVEAVSLSCVLPDGTAFERVVRGYLTGDDGTLGVPGKWEFRSGRWLANLLSAMGTAAAGVYADVAIAEALAGASILGSVSTSDTTERIQEFFLQRAEEILPVVWVESGTPVYLVMLEGVTIDGLPAEEHYPVASSIWD
ncbi:MAG: TraB/VirB10 family protein [Candidatus Tectomicrobia bacterium]|nr:TraB/VirB10 family protein [Candidatus Tectomicrobia bacterium]